MRRNVVEHPVIIRAAPHDFLLRGRLVNDHVRRGVGSCHRREPRASPAGYAHHALTRWAFRVVVTGHRSSGCVSLSALTVSAEMPSTAAMRDAAVTGSL